MSTSEKFCLKLAYFQNNVYNAFRSLRKDEDFTDITLACEDGQELEAHKVILAAVSPIFQKLLKTKKHAHPLIYMRGIKSANLMAIVNFVYNGEVSIYQEDLQDFLSVAKELKLTGIDIQSSGNIKEEDDLIGFSTNINKPQSNDTFLNSPGTISNQTYLQHDIKVHIDNEPIDSSMALPKVTLSGNMKELDEQVKSLMVLGHNWLPNRKQRLRAHVCQVCGKEGRATAIMDHIEATHMEGITLPCNECEKTFRTRDRLRYHTRYMHMTTR